MRGIVLGGVVALVALGAGAAPLVASPKDSSAVVASITDGDTLRLTNGQRVRLLQIDAEERGGCSSLEAARTLGTLAPVGSVVTLATDPALDTIDQYGRLLRYVKHAGVNVNIRLVVVGAARPYFYRGERGRYAARLVAAANQARAAKRGLWGACAAGGGLGIVGAAPPAQPAGGKCDGNYAGGCVPIVSHDLDCADIRSLGITALRVVGSDVHRLDGDGDGYGCE